MTNKDTGLQLHRYVENIEKFEEEKKGISEAISEAYKEAKAAGFDTRTIKKLIKLRQIDKDKRAEEGYLLRTYAEAIQMELF